MHYYQHHIGDFIKATARLSDAQAMAYLRLIWKYYDDERALPNEMDVLAFQIGASESDVELILRSYFKLENDEWHQTRCDAEIDEYHQKAEQASKAGKASAQARLNKRLTDVEQPLNGLSTNHKPITNNQEPVTKNQVKAVRATALCPPDVDAGVWDDWKQLRKNKRATVTETVVEQARKEATKAGMSLNQFLKEWCLRGSQGLKAEWLTNGTDKRTEHQKRQDAQTQAIFGHLYEQQPKNLIQGEVYETQPITRRLGG